MNIWYHSTTQACSKILPISNNPSTFTTLSIGNYTPLNKSYKIFIFLHLDHRIGGIDPTPHARTPRRMNKFEEANLTNVVSNTFKMHNALVLNWSHLHAICFLSWLITFCLLWQSLTKELFKTHAFMDAWSWCFSLLCLVKEQLDFPNFVTRSCLLPKCITSRYSIA